MIWLRKSETGSLMHWQIVSRASDKTGKMNTKKKPFIVDLKKVIDTNDENLLVEKLEPLARRGPV